MAEEFLNSSIKTERIYVLTLIPANSAGDPGATESIVAKGVSFKFEEACN